jgi:hypothetical protein
MMTMPFETGRTAAAALLLVFVAGCTSTNGQVLSAKNDNWGEANRQTMAAQVIDPAPVYEDATAPTSGTQVAGAIERVRTDKVKKPERVKTSTIQGSGSDN